MRGGNLDAKAIFKVACLIDSGEGRDAYLKQVCGDDVGIYDRVIKLLVAHDDQSDFLESPAAGVAATVDIPTIAERPGTKIGPYKLLEEIGEGGMGVVYMAHQQEPVRRKVALKIIKPGMDTREVIARFEAERQALAMMDHPNIAKVHDAGTTESGRPYFVMELVNGVPITDYCDDNHLTTDQRLELFIAVCNAVQHAHQKGIIHRDIKPTNILVTLHDGVPVPKIIDFGISKAINQELTANTMYTGFGQIVGTPMYMSPEQAEISGLDVDTRSDIYSLGVLLYELLTGTTPFDQQQLKEAGLDEMRRLIREQEPERPSTRISTLGKAATTMTEHRSTTPAELSHTLRQEVDWIVMKALEKDRTRRYETATDFARDIQRYLNDEAVVACPPSKLYRLRKFTRRNRTAVATTLAIALALIVGAGVAAGQAYRATKAERFANKQLEIAKEQRRLAKEQEQLAKKQKKLAEEAAERERNLRAEAEQATKRAEAARKQAEAVTDFLVEAFRSPDPERDGRTITVAEVLDQASDRLSKSFSSNLPLRGQLLHALGRTYESLGLPREAVELLEKASEIRGNSSDADERETLELKSDLNRAYLQAGRGQDALRLGEEIVRHAESALGAEDACTLEAKTLVANAHLDLNHVETAIELFEDVLPVLKKIQGSEHRVTLDAMSRLARAYDGTGRHDQSLQLYQRIFEISERIYGRDFPDTIVHLQNLGGCYLRAHRHNEAIPLLREALMLHSKVQGPQHPITLTAMNNLAVIYGKIGRVDEAIALLEQLGPRLQERLGVDHPDTYRVRMNLVMCYQRAGRTDDGIKLLESMLKATESKYGTNHRLTLEVLNGLARLHLQENHHDTAISLLKQALQRYAEEPGGTAVEAVVAGIQLASALRQVGRDDEAVAQAETSLRLAREVNFRDASLLNEAAVVYSAVGQYADAVKLLEEALPLMQEQAGPEAVNTASNMTRLGICYIGVGRYGESVPLLEKALAIQKRLLGKEHPLTLASMGALADAYYRIGLYNKSISLHEESLELMKKVHGMDSLETLKEMRQLASTYRSAGRFADALQLAEETWQSMPSSHPKDRLRAKSVFGACLRDAGQIDKAITILEETAADQEVDRPRHPHTLRTLRELAAAYQQAGRIEQAVKVADRTMAIRRETQSAEHPETLSSASQLGSLYLQQAEYTKAEPLLIEAFTGFSKRHEAKPTSFDQQQMREAAEELVELYQKQDKTEEADVWKAKLEDLNEQQQEDDQGN